MKVKWNKRFETTPKDQQEIWMYSEYGISKGKYGHGMFLYKSDDGEYERDKDVTHWADYEEPDKPEDKK